MQVWVKIKIDLERGRSPWIKKGPVSPDDIISPSNEFAINEVPLEDVHVEDVQVERVGLHAVEFAIGAHFGLSLVKVRLGTGLTVQLLNVIGRRVEEIAVIGLLVGGGEASKDQYVFVGDLVEAAPLKTDPVGVLFDPKVQGLPVLSPSDVELLYQIGPLASIETGHNVQSLVVECYRCVEVSPCIQTCNLSPRVTSYIIYFTFVHGFTGEGTSNSIDL